MRCNVEVGHVSQMVLKEHFFIFLVFIDDQVSVLTSGDRHWEGFLKGNIVNYCVSVWHSPSHCSECRRNAWRFWVVLFIFSSWKRGRELQGICYLCETGSNSCQPLEILLLVSCSKNSPFWHKVNRLKYFL